MKVPEFIEFRGVLDGQMNEEAKCNWEIHREEESQCYINRDGSCMQSLPTMPWNFGGASQFTINFDFTG